MSPTCGAQITARYSTEVFAGHLGVKKTTNKIKQKFYWCRLKDSVKLWICNCTLCGVRKSNRRVNKSQPQNYQVGASMDRVATDILGPFPQSESDNRYVLLMGDAYAIPEFSAKTVAQKLVYEFFSRFCTPFDLHSDQGRNYESQLFKEVCELLEVNKTRSSPYHPQSNGMIERFNRTLIDMMLYTQMKIKQIRTSICPCLLQHIKVVSTKRLDIPQIYSCLGERSIFLLSWYLVYSEVKRMHRGKSICFRNERET